MVVFSLVRVLGNNVYHTLKLTQPISYNTACVNNKCVNNPGVLHGISEKRNTKQTFILMIYNWFINISVQYELLLFAVHL